jgi:hypothetical protein
MHANLCCGSSLADKGSASSGKLRQNLAKGGIQGDKQPCTPSGEGAVSPNAVTKENAVHHHFFAEPPPCFLSPVHLQGFFSPGVPDSVPCILWLPFLVLIIVVRPPNCALGVHHGAARGVTEAQAGSQPFWRVLQIKEDKISPSLDFLPRRHVTAKPENSPERALDKGKQQPAVILAAVSAASLQQRGGPIHGKVRTREHPITTPVPDLQQIARLRVRWPPTQATDNPLQNPCPSSPTLQLSGASPSHFTHMPQGFSSLEKDSLHSSRTLLPVCRKRTSTNMLLATQMKKA